MPERFRVTKSDKAVLFRNYGATEGSASDVSGKSDELPEHQQIVIVKSHPQSDGKDEEERDTGTKT